MEKINRTHFDHPRIFSDLNYDIGHKKDIFFSVINNTKKEHKQFLFLKETVPTYLGQHHTDVKFP